MFVISVADKLSVATAEITNIVYYYPLIDGIGNFLKRPRVKIAEVAESQVIIEKGVREFLDTYKDTVYQDGTVAKLGIYCGTIEKLEEMVYPLVSSIAAEYGYGSDVILKFHRGNKLYPPSADSQLQFDSLDKPFSRIRIVLLVQIGKEGWDCRSLAGIILSQEGDCPKNMVLQTSCRCLRQVDKDAPETALIYLNDSNAEKLNAQLQQAHHISLKEFAEADNPTITLNRYDRTAYLKLPKVDFYQLKVNYETLIVEEADPQTAIPKAADDARALAPIIKTTDFTMKVSGISVDDAEYGTVHATFPTWLHRIVKGSFGMITPQELDACRDALYKLYLGVTYERDGVRYYSSRIDQAAVEANIRKAFSAKRTFNTTEEIIPAEASLLNIANFTPTIRTTQPDIYYPKQEMVERIVQDDAGKLKLSKDIELQLDLAKKQNDREFLRYLYQRIGLPIGKDRSFHYLPYRTDSSFEQTFLDEALKLQEMDSLGLEVYYNGDRAMTGFKIRCFKRAERGWQYVGMYTPDFLIIQRREGKIHKAIIVETKGGIYANDPTFKDKRAFMETEFLRGNNAAFGYERFEYLYLEDTLSDAERINAVHQKIVSFFN